jgi:hypothetical protein
LTLGAARRHFVAGRVRAVRQRTQGAYYSGKFPGAPTPSLSMYNQKLNGMTSIDA